MKIPRKVFGDLAEAIPLTGAKKATKYLDSKTVVKASRIGRLDRRETRTHIIFTVGAPNYEERRFIADCKKADEKLPVTKLQLRFDKGRKNKW